MADLYKSGLQYVEALGFANICLMKDPRSNDNKIPRPNLLLGIIRQVFMKPLD